MSDMMFFEDSELNDQGEDTVLAQALLEAEAWPALFYGYLVSSYFYYSSTLCIRLGIVHRWSRTLQYWIVVHHHPSIYA